MIGLAGVGAQALGLCLGLPGGAGKKFNGGKRLLQQIATNFKEGNDYFNTFQQI